MLLQSYPKSRSFWQLDIFIRYFDKYYHFLNQFRTKVDIPFKTIRKSSVRNNYFESETTIKYIFTKAVVLKAATVQNSKRNLATFFFNRSIFRYVALQKNSKNIRRNDGNHIVIPFLRSFRYITLKWF